jgi:hypothetical protein
MAKGRLSGSGGPGGGAGSRSLGKATTYFGGQPSTRINERGVSQIGQSMGNHATDSTRILNKAVEPVRVGPMGGMGSERLGNEVAATTQCGPGGSRSVMPSGGQAQHGPVAGKPAAQSREILNDFGPDSAGVRGRR